MGTTARIATIAIQKGGGCKTTAAVNIAAAAAELGARTLLIDLDPQGDATEWLGARNAEATASLLTGQAADSEASAFGVEVLGGGPWLLNAEMQIAGEPGRELILRDVLGEIDGFDLVVIDTPRTESVLTHNALTAAGEVWAPVIPSSAEVKGLVGLEAVVTKIRRINPDLAISAVIPSRIDARLALYREGLEWLGANYDGRVTPKVPEGVRVKEAFAAHKPITAFDRRSPAAIAFRDIAAHLLDTSNTNTKAI
jgi:chromosome partitioning protein